MKVMNSTAIDGEYMLWYPLRSRYIRIYCHNMTEKPSEYLTLPAGGSSNYIYKGSSSYSAAWGKSCRGEFSKVRLLLTHPLRILRSDVTFMATNDPTCSPLLVDDGRSTTIEGYGGAGGCGGDGAGTGQFHIDLSNTFFKVPGNIYWIVQGDHPRMSRYMKSNDGQLIFGSCGGYCGACNPSSGKYIPLDLPGNYFSWLSQNVLCLTSVSELTGLTLSHLSWRGWIPPPPLEGLSLITP